MKIPIISTITIKVHYKSTKLVPSNNLKVGVNSLANSLHLFNDKIPLLTSKPVFSSYQGESTIFDKRNFFSQTPDTNNQAEQKGAHNDRLFNNGGN